MDVLLVRTERYVQHMSPDERRQISAALAQHRGRWVAVRGSAVVASAPTLAELEREADLQPGDRRLAVPARHREPYFRR
jgi:hypothetical protein